jgi:Insertion element 4 transposase N-terminal
VAAGGGHGHRIERALNAEMTMLCLVTGSLFPGQGYDMILAKAFGMPGAPARPGTPVPAGPALSLARARLGGQAMRWAYELDAAGRRSPGRGRDRVRP